MFSEDPQPTCSWKVTSNCKEGPGGWRRRPVEAGQSCSGPVRPEKDECDHVDDSAILNTLLVSAGATVAVDVVIFTALISATFASFSATAAARPLQFAT